MPSREDQGCCCSGIQGNSCTALSSADITTSTATPHFHNLKNAVRCMNTTLVASATTNRSEHCFDSHVTVHLEYHTHSCASTCMQPFSRPLPPSRSQVDSAVQLLAAASKSLPDSPEIWYYLGVALAKQNSSSANSCVCFWRALQLFQAAAEETRREDNNNNSSSSNQVSLHNIWCDSTRFTYTNHNMPDHHC